MEQETLYVFAPLKHPTSIRLFELYPAPAETALSGRLIQIHQGPCPRYGILAPASDPSSLEVGSRGKSIKEVSTGTMLRVTENIYSLLHCLRKRIRTSMFLWISSVCLDHLCQREIRRHAAHLNWIYRDAWSLVTWNRVDVEVSNPWESDLSWRAFKKIKYPIFAEMRETILPYLEKVKYNYEPLLHSDSIRVLELLPGVESIDKPIMCRLLEVRRSEASYEALSYAWGPPEFSKCLYEIDSGTTIRITENLHHALRVFRLRNNRRTLWIDAVCIDQGNIYERNHQVKNMSSIYRNANKVLVWLGPEDCSFVLASMHKIAESYLHITAPIDVSAEDDGYESDDPNYVDVAGAKQQRISTYLNHVRKCDLAALGDFFGKAWFRRVWVVQEFMLAADTAIYACRNKISLRLLESCIDALISQTHLLSCRPISYNQEKRDRLLWDMESVKEMIRYRLERQAMGKRTLYQCCRVLIDRHCHDERDKVYAALGLADNDLTITPDYGLTLLEVRLDLVKKSLLAGDFSVLHHAETHMNDEPLQESPSFLPILSSELVLCRPLLLGGEGVPKYTAGFTRHFVTKLSPSASVSLRGVLIDHIFHTDSFREAINDLTVGLGTPFKNQLLLSYQSCEALKRSTSTTAFKEAFWRTIHLDFRTKEDGISRQGAAVDLRFLNHTSRTNIARTFRKRSFFMTEKGYMGMGPKWLRSGDGVAIFDGGETPFVLRKVRPEDGQDTWKLLGDCYVDGWMDGDYFGHKVVDEPEEETLHTISVRARKKTSHKGVTPFRGRRLLKSGYFTLC